MTRSARWITQSWRATSNRTASDWRRSSKTTSYRKRRSECVRLSRICVCVRDHSRRAHHFVCVCRCQKPDQLGPAELPSVKEEDDEEDDDDEDVEIETLVIEPPTERWDCETIISESESIQFLKDHVTLKTGVMMLKIHIFDQVFKYQINNVLIILIIFIFLSQVHTPTSTTGPNWSRTPQRWRNLPYRFHI